MTASNFNCVPSLPVLHSKDLINWKIVDYALEDLKLDEACKDAEQKTTEQTVSVTELKKIKVNEKYNYRTPIPDAEIYLQVKVADGGICTFAYSVDGKSFHPFSETFKARQGKWIGAKTGLFIMNRNEGTSRSWVDVDWFRIEK